ncbi:MAG: IPTL-CTERM sorting domain-containing protein [Xanthomonadales bacterium]|nr:IPTL-CTERM sorting domain-containing protein [Xanthomonadales bacterium]
MSLPIDLTVNPALPGFSKSFAPGAVPLGGRSTLTFTMDNALNSAGVGNLDFNDNLPVGMAIASPSNASTDCISAGAPNTTLTADPGTSTIILNADGNTFIAGFEVLPAGATCTAEVDVVATGVGSLDNVSGDLLADFVSAGRASATLDVTVTPIAIQKSFTDDPTPPGGTVTLEFVIDNYDRSFPATGIAFNDSLPAGLIFDSVLSNDCGGVVTGNATSVIGFSSGTLGPATFCVIQASLTVPSGTIPGIYTNTTDAITATVDGSPVVGNMASDDLFAEPAPVLTKEFLDAGTLAPDPVVDPGAMSAGVVLRFTVTNTGATDATEVEFVDELTDGSGGFPPDPTSGFLPFPVTVVLPPVPDPPCGAGSSLALVSVGTDREGLELTGGSLAAAGMVGDSCTFDVTLTIPAGFPPGIYTNTTEQPTATVGSTTYTGKPASDTLTVVGAPTLAKAFTDDPVGPGSTVTLEFSLTYPADASGDATGIIFTDDLAPVLAGLTATGLPLAQVCDPDGPGGDPGTGTLSGSSGDTLFGFVDGTLSPGESCTFSVTLDVPAGAASGSYTNTTTGVFATVGGLAVTSLAASDDLDVTGLVFTKEFLNNPVIAGETSTLKFTIDNIHPTDDATITVFTDNLTAALAGLTATGAPGLNTCGGTLSGTTSLLYVGGSVLSGASCTIEVEVLVPPGSADGEYRNVTSVLSADQGGAVTADPATDLLVVNSNLLQLTKAFTDDPVAPGDSVTLEFILTNLEAVEAASLIGFTDNLGAALTGLTFDSVLLDDCGGTVGGTGTDMITVSGVSLAGAASCTLRVSLSVPVAASGGIYTNTTSGVTGTIGGFAVTGDAVSDELQVIDLLLFSKSFDGPTTATGAALLTFTITNPGASTATDLRFEDDLGNVIPGLIATSLPAVPCGPGSSITGISMLTFEGGELPPSGGTCSFDVEVMVPASATAGTFPNMTSDLFQGGLEVAEPATADLTIEPPPTFAKLFTPDSMVFSGVSTLTFTVDNSASAVAASNLSFTDNLPAGIVIANPTNASSTCGGMGNAVAGAVSFTYSGGSVGAGATCTVQFGVTGAAEGMHVNVTEDLTSSSGNSGTATDTITILPEVDVSVTKDDGVTSAAPGGSLTYTIVASNAGPSADPSVTLTDTFPAVLICTHTSVAAGGATGNTAAGAGNLTETLSMPAGSSVTYTASCTIDSDAAGTLSNTATVVTSIPDNNSANNSATDADTVLTSEADLSVSKDDGVTSAVPGGSLTYTIVASNTGPSADPSVSLADIFPADLTCAYTSVAAGGATGNTAVGAGNLAETLSMPAGSSVTFTASCTIDSDATGTLSNTATVSASVTDNNAGNDSATDADTVLTPEADLSVTKTDGVTQAIPGETLAYTIVASNAGPSDDNSVALTDVLPAELSCTYTSVAAGGATGNTAAGVGNLAETLSMPVASSVTYTVLCDIDPAATGTLSNTAVVSGPVLTRQMAKDNGSNSATNSVSKSSIEVDNNSGNNSATDDDTELTPEAGLSITKTSGVDSVVFGENLTYTLTVTNQGPSDSSGGTVTDVLPAGLEFVSSVSGCTEVAGVVTCPFGPLSNGSSIDLTFVALVVMSEAGIINNIATVAGNETNPLEDNNFGEDSTAVLPVSVAIPTLSGWMLLLMTLLIAGFGMRLIRRRT